LDSQVAGYVVSQSKGVFKLVGKAIEVAPYGIATRRRRPASNSPWRFKRRSDLIANGTYGAILKHYGVTLADYRRRKSSSTGHLVSRSKN